MVTRVATAEKTSFHKQVGHGIVFLALTGSSVGGFLGMVALATRALGR
jgi:hypothetical protein